MDRQSRTPQAPWDPKVTGEPQWEHKKSAEEPRYKKIQENKRYKPSTGEESKAMWPTSYNERQRVGYNQV